MISLGQYHAMVVSLPGARDRRQHIDAHFRRLGIPHSFADGVSGVGKIRGAARGHIRAFDAAPDPPFLVLEDDVECLLPAAELPDFPDSADAIYLGVNPHGCLPNQERYVQRYGHRSIENLALASVHDAQWLRLHSMISAHAILFLTDTARRAFREQLRIADRREIPLDVRYAYLMRELEVFTPTHPVFAESVDLQPPAKRTDARANLTRRPLQPASEGEERTSHKRGWKLTARVVKSGPDKLDWEVVDEVWVG